MVCLLTSRMWSLPIYARQNVFISVCSSIGAAHWIIIRIQYTSMWMLAFDETAYQIWIFERNKNIYLNRTMQVISWEFNVWFGMQGMSYVSVVDCSSWIVEQATIDCLNNQKKKQIFHLALENQLDVNCNDRTSERKKKGKEEKQFAEPNVSLARAHKPNIIALLPIDVSIDVYLLSFRFVFFVLFQSITDHFWLNFSFASCRVRSARYDINFMPTHGRYDMRV